MKLRIKILLIVLGAVIYWLLTSRVETEFKVDPKHAPTVGMLTETYRENNEKYFYGGLPEKKTTIKLDNLIEYDAVAQTRHFDDSWVIVIDPEGNASEKQAEMSLFHEQCHQWDSITKQSEGVDSHSGKFQDCMLRGAEKGAFKDLW